MDIEEDYIAELTWRERILGELRHWLSPGNFRLLLTNALILTNAFYFTSIDYESLDLSNPMQLIMSKILLKVLVACIIIHLFFYRAIRFFLRMYFHMHVRNKFLIWKKKLEENGRFSLLREMHGIYKILSFFIRNYIYNLGYFTRNDLRMDVAITEEIKEEMLNDILMDCYKWMCCLIHLLFTLFFIWDYVNFWLILLALLGILLNFLMAYFTFPVVMNLEVVNKIRLDIIKDRNLGKKAMRFDKS